MGRVVRNVSRDVGNMGKAAGSAAGGAVLCCAASRGCGQTQGHSSWPFEGKQRRKAKGSVWTARAAPAPGWARLRFALPSCRDELQLQPGGLPSRGRH